MLWALTVLGLLLAHATNNLLNDATDSHRGLDKGNYFRNRYGVHALEQGLVSKAAFYRVLIITGGAAALVAIALLALRGPGAALAPPAWGAVLAVLHLAHEAVGPGRRGRVLGLGAAYGAGHAVRYCRDA